jgi:GAF domain-containing protein
MNAVDDLTLLNSALARNDVHEALRYLNARTPHRFTGIFRYHGDLLQNVHLFDREYSRSTELLPAFALKHSFCGFVQATNRAFVVTDGSRDAHLRAPPSHMIVSYCGVPLRDPHGCPLGTLCHFDFGPIVFADLDLDFLEATAPALVRFLQP